jgi:hypothetical protein
VKAIAIGIDIMDAASPPAEGEDAAITSAISTMFFLALSEEEFGRRGVLADIL